MNILAIETSAQAASAAVMRDGVLISESFSNVKLTHSQTILPMVQSMLACSHLELSQIDVFAAAAGPGSFTGLRIGIAAVKGMAFALGKPCVGVSTLEAMARQLTMVQGIVCPVMDARCSQVYTALFSCRDGELTRLREDEAVSLDELMEQLSGQSQPVFLVGDGAQLCYNRGCKEIPQVRLAPWNLVQQRASGVCAAAFRLAGAGRLTTPQDLVPSYLRLPQAQRELLAKQKGKSGF